MPTRSRYGSRGPSGTSFSWAIPDTRRRAVQRADRRSTLLARPRPGVGSGRKGHPGVHPRAIRGFGPRRLAVAPAVALARTAEDDPRAGGDESRRVGPASGDGDEAQRVGAAQELLEELPDLRLEGLDSLADAVDLGLDCALVKPPLFFALFPS